MNWTAADIERLKNRGLVINHVSDINDFRAKAENNGTSARKGFQKAGIIKVKTEHTELQIIKGNVPSKSNCYKIIQTDGHGSLAKTESLKKYEESFMWQCGKYRNLGISTPFEIYINVFYPSKRSDLDNSLKVVLDCLQKIGAITNDNNCCKIVAQKFIDKDNSRIEFKIEAI